MGYTDSILINSSKLKNFITKFCKKKADYIGEDDEYIYYNHKMLNDYIRYRLDFIREAKYITGIGPYGEWRLLLQQYKIADSSNLERNFLWRKISGLRRTFSKN